MGKNRSDTGRTLLFVWRLIRRRRLAATLYLVLTVLAAAFEGSTMGSLALAIEVVTAGEMVELSSGYGRVGAVVDSVTLGWEPATLFAFLIGLAVITQFLRSGSQFGAEVATAHLVSSIEADSRKRVFDQFMRMSFSQVSSYRTGDLASYNDQAAQLGAATISLSLILSQIFLMIGYVCVLLWLSWQVTLVAILAAGLLSLSLRPITRRIHSVADEYKHAAVDLSANVVEFLTGLRVLRTFSREGYASAKVHGEVERVARARRSVLQWQATLSPIIYSATVLGLAALLLGGYFLAGEQQVNVLTRMAAFLLVMYRLMPRLSTVNKSWGKVIGRLPFIERLSILLRTDDKEYLVDGERTFVSLRETIEFVDVTLRYSNDGRPAVSGLSFEVPKGSMVALVGESGAGKTTTADLLLRLYDPTEGQILIDGVDLRELRRSSWLDRLGVVSQDAFMFHGTVRENIVFGKLDATEAEIVKAANAANAHDFITRMPNGYDTVVGDRGCRLSGGERQRLSIARAILRDPELLILDEATSDLDSHSERLIQQATERLRSDRTVLAIAHRLSTIRMADQILVFDDGALVERGTHSQLLALGRRYARLWQLQSGKLSTDGKSQEK